MNASIRFEQDRKNPWVMYAGKQPIACYATFAAAWRVISGKSI